MSNCMPSTTSRVVSIDLASSTVIVPSLPTLSMASAMMLPIVVVPVGRDGGDLADLLAVGDLLGDPGELGDGGLDGLVDAALQEDRVGPGGDVLQALAVDGLGEDGGGRGAVAGRVGRLGGDLLDHLGAHVLVGVRQLDFLGDRDAVLGDGRRPEFLVDDDVSALGPKGHLDGAREELDAAEDFLTSGLVE